MKKLTLDDLRVDSFATTPSADGARGTVEGHLIPETLDAGCPYTAIRTCVISCRPCTRAEDFGA